MLNTAQFSANKQAAWNFIRGSNAEKAIGSVVSLDLSAQPSWN